MIVDDVAQTGTGFHTDRDYSGGAGWHCAAEGNGNREGAGHELVIQKSLNHPSICGR